MAHCKKKKISTWKCFLPIKSLISPVTRRPSDEKYQAFIVVFYSDWMWKKGGNKIIKCFLKTGNESSFYYFCSRHESFLSLLTEQILLVCLAMLVLWTYSAVLEDASETFYKRCRLIQSDLNLRLITFPGGNAWHTFIEENQTEINTTSKL